MIDNAGYLTLKIAFLLLHARLLTALSQKLHTVIFCLAVCCNNVAGQLITTICGDGTSGTAPDGQLAQYGWVAGPVGANRGYGNKIYYSDSRADKVRFIGLNNLIGTVAGNGTPGYSGDGGLAINAQLYNPGVVITDNVGNVYFIDQFVDVIRKVSTSGIITTIAGNQGF